MVFRAYAMFLTDRGRRNIEFWPEGDARSPTPPTSEKRVGAHGPRAGSSNPCGRLALRAVRVAQRPRVRARAGPWCGANRSVLRKSRCRTWTRGASSDADERRGRHRQLGATMIYVRRSGSRRWKLGQPSWCRSRAGSQIGTTAGCTSRRPTGSWRFFSFFLGFWAARRELPAVLWTRWRQPGCRSAGPAMDGARSWAPPPRRPENQVRDGGVGVRPSKCLWRIPARSGPRALSQPLEAIAADGARASPAGFPLWPK